MEKKLVLINFKKRKSAEFFDFLLIMPLILTSILLGLIYSFWIFVAIISIPIFYFSYFLYWTKGKSLGGYIFGVTIIFFNDTGKRVYPSPLKYFQRAIEIFLYSKRYYNGIFLESYRVNSLGQIAIDEVYNSTVISKSTKIDFDKKIEYYIFEAHKDYLYEQIFTIGNIIKKIFIYGFYFMFLVVLVGGIFYKH